MYRSERVLVDASGTVARSAYLRSERTGRPIGGIGVIGAQEGQSPLHFAENEVLVGAEHTDLVDELVQRYGGEIAAARPIPERPAMLPRRQRRPAEQQPPTTLTVRFARPPASGDTLEQLLASRSDEMVMLASSAMAVAVAGLAANTEFPSRTVGLNILGRSTSMPLSTINEGPLFQTSITSDPANWDHFKWPLRMVEAWHLVESFRAAAAPETTTLAVMDSGWWFTPDGHPIVPDHELASDLGESIMQINLADGPNDKQRPLAGRGVDPPWHANGVAGMAFGGVNNNVGGAGAGGTVALPFAMGTSYFVEEVLYGLRVCAAWGIDVVNMSFGITTPFAGEDAPTSWPFNGFPVSEWNKVCQFAVDNGVVLVAAAGNDLQRLPDDTVVRPATRTPGVITVGALERDPATGAYTKPWETTRNGFLPAGSNYGSSVAIWAPGADLPVIPDEDHPDGSFGSGTSYAAPIVAGTAAMMRAVAPHVSVADIRRIMIETSWAGEGRVTHGLDAYAAVFGALAHRLPDWNEPNNTVETARPLLPVGPGRLSPSSQGFAILNTNSDADYWSFDVDKYSAITVTAQWYWRIADLDMEIQDATGTRIEGVTVSRGGTSGLLTTKALLAPGRYLIFVAGQGVTAYRLVASLKRQRLQPDRFEPNNSFDAATPLRFRASPFELIGSPHPAGPGAFDLTLHWSTTVLGGIPPYRLAHLDEDYFVFDVPTADGKQKPHIAVVADLEIAATLFDDSRVAIAQKTGHEVAFDPPETTRCYLVVSGEDETRYRLSISMFVDPRISLGDLPTYEVLPEWWVDQGFAPLNDPVTHFGVELADAASGSAIPIGEPLTFQVSDREAGMTIELVNSAGDAVRSGQQASDYIVVDTAELMPGNYALRVVTDSASRTQSLRVAPPFGGW